MHARIFGTDSHQLGFGAGLALVALAILGLTGCQQAETATSNGKPSGQAETTAVPPSAIAKPPAETVAAPAPAKAGPGRAVLEDMVAAYKKANTYADKGTLRLQAKEGDKKVEQSADYSVVFTRPNRLRMRVFEGVMVSNGKELSAFANTVPNQVVKRPAPDAMAIKTLFSDELFGAEVAGLSSQAPTQRFSWAPIQLLLLLADDPLKTLLNKSAEPVLLEPAKIDEQECQRVELARPDGKAVLWIGRQTHVLHRLQLPVDEIVRSIPVEQNVRDLSLMLDFADARFPEQIDETAFQFEIPAGTPVLETLVPPPMTLLGNPAPPFSFTGPDGKPVTPVSLKGKVVAIDFWSKTCGPCRVKLPLVEKVYAKHKDKVAFLAVNVDKPEVTDKELQAIFGELGVTLPMARDPQQDAGKKFFISALPASCILSADGVVQECQTGFGPAHDTELAAKLEKVLAGQNIYQALLKQFQDQWQESRKLYAAWVDKWAKDEVFLAPMEQEPPKVEILPRSQPATLVLTPLWKCPDLKAPGNMVAVQDANKPPRLFVLDSWKTVAEIGADGKAAASHGLDIGQREAATFIRTFAGAGKRYFLVSGAMQQQVHLFDENWKKLLSYPESTPETAHAGIADAQLADFDGDGTPEIYIGYYGEVGVQAVSLDGKQLWKNRSLAAVSRVAAIGPDAQRHGVLLCTNALGSLIALDYQGKRLEEYRVPNRLIHWVVAADLNGDQRPELAGLFVADLGASAAIGLSREGQELWTYPLPKGVHQWPIEQVIAGSLQAGGPGNWLLPGPDGSIHILAAGGKLVDKFNYGEALTGMTTVAIDGQPVLVVASSKGIEAWKVALK